MIASTSDELGTSALALALALMPALALAIDRAWGEPPAAVHPVVWMGRLLAAMERRFPSAPAGRAFAAGALGWWVGATVSVGLAWGVQETVTRVASAALPGWAGTCVAAALLAALLKPFLSLRLLIEEGLAVERALERSLAAGRERTARLCSRDTRLLDATTLRETAVESVSENLVDSVVAPLFWFAVAGLPGAALYRWANTADAMWGYRDAHREWTGKFAARADDVLSWLPARLAALLLWPVGQGAKLLVEAARTPSPNGGWPMAATALGLGVRLGKPGVYVLNAGGRDVRAGDIARAAALVRRAARHAALALGAVAGGVALLAPAAFGGGA